MSVPANGEKQEEHLNDVIITPAELDPLMDLFCGNLSMPVDNPIILIAWRGQLGLEMPTRTHRTLLLGKSNIRPLAVERPEYNILENNGNQRQDKWSVKYDKISGHKEIGNILFREIVAKIDGLNFTEIDLFGPALSEVYLVSNQLTPDSVVESISLPNLKHLSIEAMVPGMKSEQKRNYLEEHRLQARGSRVAKSLWYIMKSFSAPKLFTFKITDSIVWKVLKAPKNGFCYWNQPMIEFLQRHSQTLKVIYAFPVMVMGSPGIWKTESNFPQLNELVFSAKLEISSAKIQSQADEEQKGPILTEQINLAVMSWKQLFENQKTMKVLRWIVKMSYPWPAMREDFYQICTNNAASLERVLISLYGDTMLGKKLEFENPISSVKEFLVDATYFKELRSLKALGIGCSLTDPSVENFWFHNLCYLPSSLRIVQICTIRILSRDLDHVASLPNLKALSIIQPLHSVYNSMDQENYNSEGVNLDVLKKILSHRKLDKIFIAGFPVKEELEVEALTNTKDQDGFFSGVKNFFEGMCNTLVVHHESDSKVSKDDAAKQLNPEFQKYPTELHSLLPFFVAAGKIGDIYLSGSHGPALPFLQIGDFLAHEIYMC